MNISNQGAVFGDLVSNGEFFELGKFGVDKEWKITELNGKPFSKDLLKKVEDDGRYP